jgi:high-affinity iron transporter
MIPSLIVVFREVLEAALVVSIVMAATRGLPGRGLWTGAGIAAGCAGAAVVAFFAGAIAEAASGFGQELFNAGVLFAAVTMLGWHTVWMTTHGRDLTRKVSEVGKGVSEGRQPLYALTIVTGLAVLREGSEIVLFLYGIAAGEGPGYAMSLLSGGLLGVGAGVALGMALYFGLLRIPVRYLFSVTNWMIVLLAAGLASQAAAYLVQADVLPALGRSLWDTSWLLSERELLGSILHTLVGYNSRPDGIQLVFYGLTLLTIGGLTWLVSRPRRALRHA